MVPHEASPIFLKLQLSRCPTVSQQFRHMWIDYSNLAKTKVYDLAGGEGSGPGFGAGLATNNIILFRKMFGPLK